MDGVDMDLVRKWKRKCYWRNVLLVLAGLLGLCGCMIISSQERSFQWDIDRIMEFIKCCYLRKHEFGRAWSIITR